jgi:hypothetical protein
VYDVDVKLYENAPLCVLSFWWDIVTGIRFGGGRDEALANSRAAKVTGQRRWRRPHPIPYNNNNTKIL